MDNELDGQHLYEQVAETPEGARALAAARLRHEVELILYRAYAATTLDYDDLAELLGVGKTEVTDTFRAAGDITTSTLAEYLAAMGAEVTLTLQPLHTARKKATGG